MSGEHAPVSGADEGYLLPNATPGAGDRLAAIATLFDPATFRHLERLGLGAGWRCWEVGAGGTSVLEHLADRVGPDGHVLATDIDVSWAPALPAGNVTILRHDVSAGPPPGAPFDLVHARLVLVHVPERDRALATLAGALRPGGALLVEDADPALQPLACLEEATEAASRANRVRQGFRTLLADRGAELAYGRTLPRRLRAAGLTGVAAEAAFPVGHRACDVLELATVSMLRDQLVGQGLAEEEEIEEHLAAVRRGELDLVQPPMISCWGRRPEG